MSILSGNTDSASNAPLTLESLRKALEALRDEVPEVPKEIMSPFEHERRLLVLGTFKLAQSDWRFRLMKVRE